MKAKPTTSKPAKKPAPKNAPRKMTRPAPAKGSGINIRAEVDRRLAEAKAIRHGQRGGGPVVTAPTGERRGPGRPRTAPAGAIRPPRRSPGRLARAEALAGVKDIFTLSAIPFPTLTIAEAAGLLGCSHMHVSNSLDTGELTAVNIGRQGGARACNRILKASLEAFLAKRGGAVPAATETAGAAE